MTSHERSSSHPPAKSGREAEHFGGNDSGSKGHPPDGTGREAEDPSGLDSELADVRRERDEYLDLAQRTKADFENYRKRMARESAEAERRGVGKLARELVTVADNLERALAAGEGLSEGVELVHRELTATLQRAGVESYDPSGEPFDPAWHEALTTRPEDGKDSGVVLEVMEKGYRLDGQVLRPARVVVSE